MSNSQGDAGASARREYERRKARDEEKLRNQWGRLGGLAIALSSERRSTQVWEKGAIGEEKLGARLDSVASPTVKVLHDRRIRRTKANIDHLVITDSGVWVIDAKRYTGRPTLRVEGGLFRPRTETLMVGRRQRNKIVDGVIHQVDLVRAVVGDVPVHGALCFIDADWPLFGGSFTTRDVHVVWSKRLVKLLTTTPPHQGMNVTDTHTAITNAFPPA